MADYKNINIRNKRATFDYEIIEEWIAGIVLVGTEIKSVRLGKASITDSYCYFDKGELWIRGVNIAEYGWGTCNNHVPRRDRKLLLNRKELNKIQRALQDRGLTVVGLRLFLNERGLAKVVVGLDLFRPDFEYPVACATTYRPLSRNVLLLQANRLQSVSNYSECPPRIAAMCRSFRMTVFRFWYHLPGPSSNRNLKSSRGRGIYTWNPSSCAV